MKLSGLLGAAAAAALGLGAVVVGVVLGQDEASAAVCTPSTSSVQVDTAALPSVGSWTSEQVTNAALIINAGEALGISARGQQIAVMTAIGESSLRVLDHGDGPGPDSRGLFQQRDNGAWGTYEDRMDPTRSATNFYRALQRVDGWEELEPTIAAHKVQRNADPYHYEKSWDPAGELLVQLAGFDVDGESCTTRAGVISADGWTHPLPDLRKIWHNYGTWRGSYAHAGEDLTAPAGTPIFAAANGLVTRSSCTEFQGRSPCNIIIDHGADPATGQRIETWYVHMYPTGVHVAVGDRVTVGQHIADVGSNGNSSGPHLHLEVHLDGVTVDPDVFFASRGVDLSTRPTVPAVTAAAGQALTWARTQLGMPYVLGATGPNSYDCSGLTLRAYQAAGITLPRTSREQYTATTRISRADLQPGDLIFWSNDATAAGIYHVAIYAGKDATGADRVVQAPAPGKTVEEITLWSTNLYGYGRVGT